jgi:hypothetical protein
VGEEICPEPRGSVAAWVKTCPHRAVLVPPRRNPRDSAPNELSAWLRDTASGLIPTHPAQAQIFRLVLNHPVLRGLQFHRRAATYLHGGTSCRKGNPMPHDTLEDIAKDILSYFLNNPQAADDLEGVARWRLLRQTIRRDVEETGQALDWLVQRGLLTRVPTAGSAIFRLRAEQRAEAAAFMTQPASGETKPQGST